MPQPSQTEDRPDRENEKPLTVWLPTTIKRQLKIHAAEMGITMKEYVLRKLTADSES